MASKSNPSSKNLSPIEFRRRNKILRELENTSERKAPLVVSQSSNKKILGDRNCNNSRLSNFSKTLLKPNPKNGKLSADSHEKDQSSVKIHPLSDVSPSVEYDPVTNYTSPRPDFLRYNPNRRKEILARMKDCEDESLSDENLSSPSSVSSKRKDEVKQFENEAENEEEGYSGDYKELEADNERFWCSKDVCKWFFPFVILLLLNYYMFSISEPLHEKNSSIKNFHCHSSTYILKTHMGVGDVCFYNGNKMCDLVISDVVNYSDTWIIDENNKELSSAEGDLSDEELSPFQKMSDLVNFDAVNDSDTWIIDENNKELSSAEADESTEELSRCEENTVSTNNRNSGGYNIAIHMGVVQKCFNVGEEMCDLPASGVLSNNDFTTLDGHEPTVKKSLESMHESIDIDQKLLRDDQNEVLTNNDFITLDGHEPSVKKSVESMHESTDIDRKLLSDNRNEVAMSTDEFLMHEFSNESEEIGKEVNMVYESDKDENFLSFESNSYEFSNKFGLLAIHDAANGKLILFSVCMLSVMLAVWIVLSMYFSKSGNILKGSNVTRLSSDHPKDKQKESFSSPCSESVEENDIIETKNEGKYSNLFNQPFSSSPKDENVDFYASRPPAVELLCEFSIGDDHKCSGRTKKKGSENSELYKSQNKENSQVSWPSKTVKTATKSLSTNNGKANEKQPKKEMMNLATPTPLRRSSRLQNRVTPPKLGQKLL